MLRRAVTLVSPLLLFAACLGPQPLAVQRPPAPSATPARAARGGAEPTLDEAPSATETSPATETDTPRRAASPEGPRSNPLLSGWYNPMPGGYIGGYAADTGLDIAGFELPVYAVAAGTIVYAEAGHTGWTGRGNTNLTVLLALDEPIAWRDREITHAWYAHLSELAFEQPEGAPVRRHVEAGASLGVSGFGNGSPHLHLGLLLDGGVEQHWGDYLLFDQIAEVLGPYRPRQRLPPK